MRVLEWNKALALLKRFNIPVAEYYPVELATAKKLGFPVVIKAISPKIVHKTELGLVKIAANEEELAKAIEEIKRILKRKKLKAEIVMQKFIKGKEVIVGVKNDSTFGKVIMFGLGGVLVEVMKDTSFRIVPVSEEEAEEMIKEIKGYKVLEGYRGEKINTKRVAEIIVNISRLCEKIETSEIDFNPVIVNEKEAVVVDARIVC